MIMACLGWRRAGVCAFRPLFSATLVFFIWKNNLSFLSSSYPLGKWNKANNYLCLLKLGYAVIYVIYW